MPKTLTIFICLSLTVAIGLLFFWPKYQELKSVKEKVSQKRAELQYREEYLLNLKRLSEELKKYSDSVAKIDSILPPSLFLPSLLNFLEKTSAEAGLILKSLGRVSTQPSEKWPEIKIHSFDFSLSGSYSAFKSFLFALERSARLIKTEMISLSTFGKGPPFNFDLKIKFYSY